MPQKGETVTLLTLLLPPSGDTHHVIVDGMLWMFPIETPQGDPFSVITERFSGDYLSQIKGAYRENTVYHWKTDGTLTFVPCLASVAPAPTATYPDALTFSAKTLTGSTVTKLSAVYGIGATGSVARYWNGTYPVYYAVIADRYSRTVYNFIQFLRSTSSPTGWMCKVYKTEQVITGYSSTQVKMKKTQYTMSVSVPCPDFWSQKGVPPLWQDLIDFGTQNSPSQVQSSAETWYTRYRPAVQSLADISQVAEDLGGIPELDFRQDLLPDENYGELVAEASQKLNAIDVNVIALLKDLRHPSEMVPKLKNLSSLKRWASNYLTIHYGLLPTVSDLQNIWESMTKLKPHIDLYGYRTVSAGHIARASDMNISYTLEQHAKVAVANEDSAILDLYNRLETIGMLPTLKNIWDLIPYSFVLDWFVDVGKTLERLDDRLRLARYDIKYVTLSRKETSTVIISPSAQLPYTGTVTRARYARWTPDQCPEPPFPASSTVTASDHWLEAGAMLIQRAPRK